MLRMSCSGRETSDWGASFAAGAPAEKSTTAQKAMPIIGLTFVRIKNKYAREKERNQTNYGEGNALHVRAHDVGDEKCKERRSVQRA
jgi:hypothetical protein